MTEITINLTDEEIEQLQIKFGSIKKALTYLTTQNNKKDINIIRKKLPPKLKKAYDAITEYTQTQKEKRGTRTIKLKEATMAIASYCNINEKNAKNLFQRLSYYHAIKCLGISMYDNLFTIIEKFEKPKIKGAYANANDNL